LEEAILIVKNVSLEDVNKHGNIIRATRELLQSA
jgi:hypothetical protein